VTDVELAAACARGDAAALTSFEAAYGDELDRIAARFPRIDDAAQLVREKLFCGAAPRIAAFQGRGSLRGWVRATAVHALIDATRARAEPAAPGGDAAEVLAELAAPGDDPELDYLRRTYAASFKEAFTAAVDGLSSEERNLLRYHFLHHLTVDQIGVIYRCHRATAARRVAAARDALLAATRRQLRERLGVPAEVVDSILRLIEGRVDLSLSRLLSTSRSLPP
jgi:RNA polymerase sigma-70 factor (ECF subfamily)